MQCSNPHLWSWALGTDRNNAVSAGCINRQLLTQTPHWLYRLVISAHPVCRSHHFFCYCLKLNSIWGDDKLFSIVCADTSLSSISKTMQTLQSLLSKNFVLCQRFYSEGISAMHNKTVKLLSHTVKADSWETFSIISSWYFVVFLILSSFLLFINITHKQLWRLCCTQEKCSHRTQIPCKTFVCSPTTLHPPGNTRSCPRCQIYVITCSPSSRSDLFFLPPPDCNLTSHVMLACYLALPCVKAVGVILSLLSKNLHIAFTNQLW